MRTRVENGARRKVEEEPEDCPVCLLPHDPAIHDATGRIRKWLRDDIESRLNPPKQPHSFRLKTAAEVNFNKP